MLERFETSSLVKGSFSGFLELRSFLDLNYGPTSSILNQLEGYQFSKVLLSAISVLENIWPRCSCRSLPDIGYRALFLEIELDPRPIW